jgi:hypothetical protein
MTEMVERVAALLSRQKGGHNLPPDFWNNIRPETREIYRAQARAIIKAMREPSEEMMEACYPDEDAKPIWQDMIDAALATKKVA